MRLTSPFMIRRVQGHSMLPVLPPGTLVWGYKWFIKLRQHKVVIAERDGREIIKRIDQIKSDGLFLVGDHPEASTDSRHYGVVPRDSVRAIVVWPRTSKVQAESEATTVRPKDTEV